MQIEIIDPAFLGLWQLAGVFLPRQQACLSKHLIVKDSAGEYYIPTGFRAQFSNNK